MKRRISGKLLIFLGILNIFVSPLSISAEGGPQTASPQVTNSGPAIYIVTGNPGKWKEMSAMIPSAIQKDIDVKEIQELDPQEVMKEKLMEAASQVTDQEAYVVMEDTCLRFKAVEFTDKKHTENGLPGPLIKWFMGTLGNVGIVKMLQPFDDKNAEAITTVGVAKITNGKVDPNLQYFKGSVDGVIVNKPRGGNGFGWDKIFQPAGSDKTFGEMETQEKNSYSMRGIATRKAIDYLKSEGAIAAD